MVEISDVRIYKISGSTNVKAYASVTLDGEFAVHGIKVMESERGLWVSMPARRDTKGEFRDIFHPITRGARDKIMNAVIEAYEKETSESMGKERVEKEPEPPEEKAEETKVSVQEEVVGEESETENLKALMLKLMTELDQGDGVKYLEIVEKSGQDEGKVEEVLGELLADGEVYEPKIGRFKKV
jgi:stage V sporulation protein G